MGLAVCHFKKLRQTGLVVIASLVLVACGSGGGGSNSNSNSSSSSSAAFSQRSGPGTLITPPTTTGNSVPIVIDGGPSANAINTPYVSVTVCPPGTSGVTAACQTIDHVSLDTGSYGLRLLNSQLYSNLNLPVVANGGGQAIGECTPFGAGTTWGSVLRADIYLGGEVATSVPIQDIGDMPGGNGTVPADCSNTGTIADDQTSLGTNGILGVGLFVNDCDTCLTAIIPATYYTCTSQSCVNSLVTQSQVVKNPVALFSQDNNGTLITLPAAPTAGLTGSAPGTLIFGIGTQLNNALNGATVYPADANGNMQTTFNSVVMSGSFIDSGSNGLFFDDASMNMCPDVTWAYCPAVSPTVLSATMAGWSGAPSAVVNFSIVNLDNLANSVVAANVGGTGSPSQFDWGLPFFFGRPVFTAISGKGTPGGVGPYWAF